MALVHELHAEMLTLEAFRLYVACMHRPSAEKYAKAVGRYLSDPETHCFGYFGGSRLLGTIVVRNGEILGIAVQNTMRSHGIGRTLIEHIRNLYPVLTAETDSDSVDFYRRCGFSCEAFEQTFPDGTCIRYRCVLDK